MATVIDALVVSLGLDPKGFKKGADDASKRIKDTEGVVRKSSDAMVSSFRRVATEFIGLFVAVRSVSDVVGFLEHVNASTRQLGYDSKNFGIAAGELKNWQNIAELAGGTAEGATATIASLQKSIFNLQYGGQVSDQLIYLMRLGVQFEDAGGKARDFNAIVKQTASILEKNGRPREENFQYLQAAGFDVGITNAILDGSRALDDYLDKVHKIQQATPEQTAAANRMAQSWQLLKDKFEASARAILTRAEPAITALFAAFNRFGDYLNEHQKDIGDWIDSAVTWVTGSGGDQIKAFFVDLATVVRALADAIKFLVDAWGALPWKQGFDASPLGGPLKAAFGVWARGFELIRGNRNNNPGNLKAVGNQPHDDKGFRIFETRDEGEAAANAQLDRYAGRGINTIRGIVHTWAPQSDGNDEEAYRRTVQRSTGKGPDDPLTQSDRANLLRGIFTHETGSSDVKATSAVPLASLAPNPSALAAARGAEPTPALQTQGPSTTAPGSTHNVEIYGLHVNTQATDADRMMRDLNRDMRRKFLLAEAEPGLA